MGADLAGAVSMQGAVSMIGKDCQCGEFLFRLCGIMLYNFLGIFHVFRMWEQTCCQHAGAVSVEPGAVRDWSVQGCQFACMKLCYI